MERHRATPHERKEKEILQPDGLGREERGVVAEFLDARPGEVDVEEEEEDAEAEDGGVEGVFVGVGGGGDAVEEEVAVDLVAHIYISFHLLYFCAFVPEELNGRRVEVMDGMYLRLDQHKVDK